MVNPSERSGTSSRHRRWRGWITVAVALIAVAGCSSGPTPQMAQQLPSPERVADTPAQIEAVNLRAEGAEYVIEVAGSQPIVWSSYRDSDGRLIVELPNALAPEPDQVAEANDFVELISVDEQENGDRPLTRIVVGTREASEHSLFSEGNTLSIQLTPVGMDSLSDASQPVFEGSAEEMAVADLAAEPAEDDGWFTAEPSTNASTGADWSGDAAALEAEVAAAVAAEQAVGEPVDASQWGTDAMPALGPEPRGVEASNLHTVDVARIGPETVVRMQGDGEFRYSTFHLENPERFVVDLFGVVNMVDTKQLAVHEGPIEGVRVGQFRPRPDLVARVVVDLGERAMPRVEGTADGLHLAFAGGGRLADEASWQQGAAEAATEVVTAADTTWAEEPVEVVESAESYETAGYATDTYETETYADSASELATTDPEAYEEVRWDQTAEDAAEPVMADLATDEAAEMPTLDIAPEVTAAPATDWTPTPAPATEVAYYEAAEVEDDMGGQTSRSTTAAFEAQTIGQTDKQFVGEPMTMTLKNGDVKDVLRSFAEISGLNLVVDPEVSGSVTVELIDVPWDQALDQVLKINRLGYVLEGTIMRVAPIAKLQSEAAERQALAQAQALSVPLTTIIQRISYADAADVASLLVGGGSGLLSQRGSVTVDGRTNTLIIKELPDFINTVIAVIESLDIPEPQVMIEARIVETTKRFSRSIGVDWGFDALASAATGNTSGLVFPNNADAAGGVSLLTGGANGFLNFRLGNVLNTFQLDATLQAAENEGLINILSAPKIATLNNEAASIQSGLQIPIQTVANNTVSVQFVNATLKLEVTPHVTAEGTVLMDIDIQKREPQLAFAVVGATNAPIATKEAKTRVIVRDGGTTVIGGIYEVSTDQGEDRVPGLANVPLIKHLFKNRRRTEENEELLIFITPRVIKL